MAEEKKITKPAVKKATVAKAVSATKTKAATPKTPVKKEVVKPVVKATPKTATNLTLDVLGIDGKVSGKITLPEAIFGEKPNKQLLTQAIRVYMANQRQGNASTKTRGEVTGSTRKIYRQKGTGKARHGGIRAPIFVKGGIVHGPKPRDFSMTMPKKMKRKALYCALSGKVTDGTMTVLSGLEKIEPKTKQFVAILEKLGLENDKKRILLVTAEEMTNVKRAAHNVPGINVTIAARLSAYDVVHTKRIVFLQEAVVLMEKVIEGKE
jgi:large subunit ribosomal protein L4